MRLFFAGGWSVSSSNVHQSKLESLVLLSAVLLLCNRRIRYIERRYGGLSVGERYHTSFNQTTVGTLVEMLQLFRPNETLIDQQAVGVFLENMWRTQNAKVPPSIAIHFMCGWNRVLLLNHELQLTN